MICPHLPCYGYKKTMDFHARQGEMGFGSNLVLPNYFYPKYNLLLISNQLQEWKFSVPEVIFGTRRIQDSAEGNI